MTLARIGRQLGKTPAAVKKTAIELGLIAAAPTAEAEPTARQRYGDTSTLPEYVIIGQDGVYTEFVCGAANNAFSANRILGNHNQISGRNAAVYQLVPAEKFAQDVADTTPAKSARKAVSRIASNQDDSACQ
jgi:hypothetical protein